MPMKSKLRKRTLTYDAICKQSHVLHMAIDVQGKHIVSMAKRLITPQTVAVALSSYAVNSVVHNVKSCLRKVRLMKILMQRYIITHIR